MADRKRATVVDTARIKVLNDQAMADGDYVLYWMQQSQRSQANHALEYALEVANHRDLPVLVAFGLSDAYPEANLRHYTFMLEGLRQTEQDLKKRGLKLIIRLGDPAEVALEVARDAALIVCDRGYLRHQREWRRQVAREALCRVAQVESDVVVPLEVASPKAEYAARTLRPKIHKQLEAFLVPLDPIPPRRTSLNLDIRGIDLENMDEVLGQLDIDRSVPAVSHLFPGGSGPARRRFQTFLSRKLKNYDDHGNQPQTDDISGISPYLHFGQISPLALALELKASQPGKRDRKNRDAFLEQLIVRRELAMNFAYYTPDYDAYSAIPGWAAKTLQEHRSDPRPHRYSAEELDAGRTHDPYWNAAMAEMKYTGFMHNYMRMYWGKKILEWSDTPQAAFETTLALNNRYFLDGRDPNSYTGVAWIYGVHDRAWAERSIFGKIRYMAASGLERKCDIQAYVTKVEKLVAENRKNGS